MRIDKVSVFQNHDCFQFNKNLKKKLPVAPWVFSEELLKIYLKLIFVELFSRISSYFEIFLEILLEMFSRQAHGKTKNSAGWRCPHVYKTIVAPKILESFRCGIQYW